MSDAFMTLGVMVVLAAAAWLIGLFIGAGRGQDSRSDSDSWDDGDGGFDGGHDGDDGH